MDACSLLRRKSVSALLSVPIDIPVERPLRLEFDGSEMALMVVGILMVYEVTSATNLVGNWSLP